MNGQLQTPVLAAHYRVMPGRQQLQHQQQGTVYSAGSTDGRTLVGFSFNTGFGSGADMIFYEFAGAFVLLQPASWQRFMHAVATALCVGVTSNYMLS